MSQVLNRMTKSQFTNLQILPDITHTLIIDATSPTLLSYSLVAVLEYWLPSSHSLLLILHALHFPCSLVLDQLDDTINSSHPELHEGWLWMEKLGAIVMPNTVKNNDQLLIHQYFKTCCVWRSGSFAIHFFLANEPRKGKSNKLGNKQNQQVELTLLFINFFSAVSMPSHVTYVSGLRLPP